MSSKTITWEEMTPEFTKLHKARQKGLIVSCVIGLLFPIPFVADNYSDDLGFGIVIMGYLVVAVLAVLFSGILISGFLHTQSLRQKPFMKSLIVFPNILFLGWYFWLIIQYF